VEALSCAPGARKCRGYSGCAGDDSTAAARSHDGQGAQEDAIAKCFTTRYHIDNCTSRRKERNGQIGQRTKAYESLCPARLFLFANMLIGDVLSRFVCVPWQRSRHSSICTPQAALPVKAKARLCAQASRDPLAMAGLVKLDRSNSSENL